jgi:hypothetical protein
MNITEANWKAHEKLSKYSRDFLEFVKEDPRRIMRAGYSALETHDPKRVLQPWPTFVSPKTANYLKEVAASLFKIVKSIPRRFFSYDPEKISRYYAVSREIVDYCLYGVSDEHNEDLLARGDFIFSTSGLKCIEYNVGSNLGGGQIPIWESMYLNTPIITDFLQKSGARVLNKNLLAVLMDHIIAVTRKRMPRDVSHELNVLIAFGDRAERTVNNPREHAYVGHLYQQLLQQKYSPLKGEIIFGDFSNLKLLDDRLYYQEKVIHFLLEFSNGATPFHLRIAQEKGNVLIYNGLITELISNKLNMALMSEHRDSDMFTPEEREIIKHYVPWTRKVTAGETTYNGRKLNLEEFILSNREGLVLKPGGGHAGLDVFLGFKTPQDQWRQVVERALDEKSWVVQEKVESLPLLYQYGKDGFAEHDVVWGIFVFGSLYGGTWLRVLPKKHAEGIINLSQGAEAGVIFEVQE